MPSYLFALASNGFIQSLSTDSGFRNWQLAATDICAEKDYLALIEGKEPRPTATKYDTGSAPTSSTPSASTSSSPLIDCKLVQSKQTSDTKATKVCGLLGLMFDANYWEMYSTQRDPGNSVEDA